MKRRSLLASAGGLLAGTSACLPAVAAPAGPGERVMWPQVKLIDGGAFGPKEADGVAMVVVFWSVTCPFCRRHNPHVQKLHRAAAGKPLRVLTAARDREVESVRRYAREQGYTFPITMEYAQLAAALSTRNLIPLTITVDRRGLLRQVIPGEMFEEDVLELMELAA